MDGVIQHRETWTKAVGCRLCHLERNASPWNEVLITTDNFLMVPSKGALVLGWLLLVPRIHVLSFAALPQSSKKELGALLPQVVARATELFGRVTVFEHGAVKPGSAFGCGIDHAHVHLVPLKFDLVSETKAQHPHLQWNETVAPWLGEGRTFDLPYVAVGTHGDRCLLSQPASVERQFLRRVIARAVGTPERFDYDSHPCLENVVLTRQHWMRSAALGSSSHVDAPTFGMIAL